MAAVTITADAEVISEPHYLLLADQTNARRMHVHCPAANLSNLFTRILAHVTDKPSFSATTHADASYLQQNLTKFKQTIILSKKSKTLIL